MNNISEIHSSVFAMDSLELLALAQNPVLRGAGKLARGLAKGLSTRELRLTARGMTAEDWLLEQQAADLGQFSLSSLCSSTSVGTGDEVSV